MRNLCATVVLSFCAVVGQAQQAPSDMALLSKARAAYDAPLTRNLESFDCAIEFSWKQHFAESFRVGDEGTDEELETYFQPIRNRVTVSRDVVFVSSNLTDAAINKLPNGGMAEYLLKHAVQKALSTWRPAGMNTVLPQRGAPVHFETSASGYKLSFKESTLEVEMLLAPDMRLESATVKTPQPQRLETEFTPGPQGFLLTSWTTGEGGQFQPGNRLIFTYTYQTVRGFQLPELVSATRESHHEVWHIKLTNCTVKTGK